MLYLPSLHKHHTISFTNCQGEMARQMIEFAGSTCSFLLLGKKPSSVNGMSRQLFFNY